MWYKCSIQFSVVGKSDTHCNSFRCSQCDTNARSSSLWWTNLAPTVLHFGVAKMIQMLDPIFCGGPTLHPMYFISVWPMWYRCSIQLSVLDQPCTHCISFRCRKLWYKCSVQFSVVNQPCTHCISFRCRQCDTDARSNSLWWINLAPTVFHFGVANVIQMLDPILCGGQIWHTLQFISV